MPTPTEPSSSARSDEGQSAYEKSPRGSVERVEGTHDTYPHRRWVTWRTYLDGAFLGNAVDEAEGWRWVADMLKLEAATMEGRP